jgi:hypothetical protein
MPLPEIRRYAQLVMEGPGNEAGRLEVLRRHEAKVQQQVADLQEALGIIHAKVEIYGQHLAAGTADQLWRNGPECETAPDGGSGHENGPRRPAVERPASRVRDGYIRRSG